jgi:hypothetical protein
MTGSLEDREKGYEAKWAHDEEMHFHVIARRNRLLGHWAAGEMGLQGTDADAYTQTLIDLEIHGGHDLEVTQKIRGDFDVKNIVLSDHVIEHKIQEFQAEATAQLMNEKKA